MAEITGTTGSTLEDAAADTRDRVEDAASHARQRLEDAVGYFREHGVQDVVSDVMDYAKTHPAQAIIGAAVLGFVAGQLIRRS